MRNAPGPRSLESLRLAEDALSASDRELTAVDRDGRGVSWTCHCAYEGHSSVADVLKGRGCIRCKRKDRTPRAPTVLAVGTRSGELEVVEYLGVIDGLSRVRARNVRTGIEAVMLTGDFTKQKRRLLSQEDKNAVTGAGVRYEVLHPRPGRRLTLPVGTKNAFGVEIVAELPPVNRRRILWVRSPDGTENEIVASKFARYRGVSAEERARRMVAGLRAHHIKRREEGRFHTSARLTYGRLRSAATELGFKVASGAPDEEILVRRMKVDVICHCGRTYSPLAANVMEGLTGSCGCVVSRPQAEIVDFLKSLGEVVQGDVRGVLSGRLELDIVLPERKIAIEYHGLHWHGEEVKGDRAVASTVEKRRGCEEAGYRLIVIFEDEWLSRPDVVRSRLKAILGRPARRVGARKLTVQRLSSKVARAFLEKHHIQGAGGYGEFWGLAQTGEILAVASFARPNASRSRTRGDDSVRELVRFACAPDVQVVGGLSRLLAAHLRENPTVKEVLSYSDNRWSQGGVYRTCGFRLDGETPPGYWYFYKGDCTRRLHRFALRKSVLVARGGDPSKTERELAREAGYDRIWDLGTKRWVLART